MSSRRRAKSLLAAVTLLLAASAFAEKAPVSGLDTLLHQGKAAVDLRSRYENVDQDGFDKEANAFTLLSRVTWTSGTVAGFSGLIQVDNVSYFGSGNFNNTENGETAYPVVADPDYTEINQAYLAYGLGTTNLVLGRQSINHGSQRFLGGVAWRQNEQTYDALRMTGSPVADLSLDYSYIWNVNRIFGPEGVDADWRGDIHVLRADYNLPFGTLSGFVYHLDFDTQGALANATATYGLEYVGNYKLSNVFSLGVSLTAAQQKDVGNSPLDYSAPYYLAELTGKFKPVSIGLGYEVLASDNGVGFQTPLATLHKFQGFADKFLGTPAGGVEDKYLKVAGVVAGIKLAAVWHDFKAESGSMDYGSEFDLSAVYAFNKHLSLLLKYASYDENGFSVDTDKLWLTLSLKI